MNCSNTLLVSLTAAAFLTACGGGGSDSASTVTPPSSVPLAQAIHTLQTTGVTKSLAVTGTATIGSQSYSVAGNMTYTQTALATAATFEGHPALSGTITLAGSATVNGQTVPLSGTETDYVSAGYVSLGFVSTGDYCVVTTATAPPASASVGTTGQLDVATCYTDSNKASVDYISTRTFAVSVGTTSSNVTLTVTTADGTSGTTVLRYLVGTDGSIVFAGLDGTAAVNGSTLTLHGQ